MKMRIGNGGRALGLAQIAWERVCLQNDGDDNVALRHLIPPLRVFRCVSNRDMVGVIQVGMAKKHPWNILKMNILKVNPSESHHLDYPTSVSVQLMATHLNFFGVTNVAADVPSAVEPGVPPIVFGAADATAPQGKFSTVEAL